MVCQQQCDLESHSDYNEAEIVSRVTRFSRCQRIVSSTFRCWQTLLIGEDRYEREWLDGVTLNQQSDDHNNELSFTHQAFGGTECELMSKVFFGASVADC